MFKYLFNKLPAVRRLRAELSETDVTARARAHDLRVIQVELSNVKGERDHIRDKRNLLHRQVDELNGTVLRQSISIDGLREGRRLKEDQIQHLSAEIRAGVE